MGGLWGQGEGALLGLSKQLTKPQRKPDSTLLSPASDPNAHYKGQSRVAQSREKYPNHVFLQKAKRISGWADGWTDRWMDH